MPHGSTRRTIGTSGRCTRRSISTTARSPTTERAGRHYRTAHSKRWLAAKSSSPRKGPKLNNRSRHGEARPPAWLAIVETDRKLDYPDALEQWAAAGASDPPTVWPGVAARLG